jgi:hypothetical protein
MKGFLTALGMGIGLGVLFAPENGKATRAKVRERIRGWFDIERTSDHPAHNDLGSPRFTEKRPADRSPNKMEEGREKTLDKTLADSFPTSDPPSSIPNPAEDDCSAA